MGKETTTEESLQENVRGYQRAKVQILCKRRTNVHHENRRPRSVGRSCTQNPGPDTRRERGVRKGESGRQTTCRFAKTSQAFDRGEPAVDQKADVEAISKIEEPHSGGAHTLGPSRSNEGIFLHTRNLVSHKLFFSAASLLQNERPTRRQIIQAA